MSSCQSSAGGSSCSTAEPSADFTPFVVPEGQPLLNLTPAVVAKVSELMAEENDEYLEAANAGNLVEVADALGDQLYILCGTIITHGLQHVIEDVFREIHQSNLSKLGPDGEPLYREDGKVMKGPNYFRPDIASVLEGRSPQRSR